MSRTNPATRGMPCLGRPLVLAFAMFLSLAIFTPDVAQAQRARCDRIAHDYARANSGGGAVRGAVRGSVRGGITGRIIDGRDGARRGRRIGATVGAMRGAARKSRDYDWLYDQAYARCMGW